jgi:hypothetical protein
MSRLDPPNKNLAEKQPSDPDHQCARASFLWRLSWSNSAEAMPNHKKAITPKAIAAKPRSNSSHHFSASVSLAQDQEPGRTSGEARGGGDKQRGRHIW